MSKKILLDSRSVDLTMFDDEPKKKKQIRRILEFVDKYTGCSMSRLIQLHEKNNISHDILKMSAYNVYISTLAGEHRGRHSVSKAYRDLFIKSTYSKERKRKEKINEKVTDKSLENFSFIKNEDKVMREAINEGKASILGSLMFSLKDLIDSMKFVVRSLDIQEKED